MRTLHEILLDSRRRTQVVDDCTALVGAEVASKSGLAGLVVKGAYAVTQAVRPGVIREVLDHLLEPFVDVLAPFYEAHCRRAEGSLEAYFGQRSGEIAAALLGITDARALKTKNAVFKKAYEKLRPVGLKHTAAALPRLARVIAEHAGRERE